MSIYVLPLADPAATLERVGGKGMSLAKMAQAGLPVPGGFHLTTAAYDHFVALNGIQERILSALQGADLTDPARLESLSSQIGAYFSGGEIPPEIAREVAAAYAALGGLSGGRDGEVAVAVRSSATAEDLPGASFAGQQETYLNICGAEAVLEAVKKCWASLWTGRAIAYRARQGIDPETVSLAVVVQELVAAEAAGVLFTANPVSGSRGEMVITATWGLGEALVSGLVTPDTLTVAKATGKILHYEAGDKQVMTVRTAAGVSGQPVPAARRKARVLRDAQAAALAQLGAQIEQLYSMPMDIEWALANGRFAIVQARPVTSLPEPPLEWIRPNPKSMMARGSFAEFVPEAVSPLFATLAVPIAEAQTQKMMAGYFGVKDASGYEIKVINGYTYIGIALNGDLMWRMTILSFVETKKLLATSQARWEAEEVRVREAAAKWQRNLQELPAADLLAGVREIFSATAQYYTVAQSGPIPAALLSEMIFNGYYRALVKRKADPATPVLLVGSDSIALRTEKSLYDLAMYAKDQPALAEAIRGASTEAICAALAADPVPAPFGGEFATRFAAHLAAYGYALYDLDFAKPVPVDDPSPVVEGLKAYMDGMAASPYERQRGQIERRTQVAQAILARLDPLRRRWFARSLKWAQDCAPQREDCIAELGLGYPQMRKMLRELGRRLAAGGAIADPGDVYWLEAAEADALAAASDQCQPLRDHRADVEARKARRQRERAATPPMTLPEQHFLRKLVVHDNPRGNTLKGYGASAGKVTARACVLRGPEDFGTMRPGDVIVSVTTTPAWTPLFAMAAAVVTDIGGPLSHSSIVAREYGIPAVMATGVATHRIQNGQIITVDGSAGTVTL